MPIDVNNFQFQPNAFEVSQAARAAVDDQRAAETRRKLRKAAAEAASSGNDEESLLIQHWLDGAEKQADGSAEKQAKPADSWPGLG
jgi:hypothetical protein